jgi:hypothetical protein
MSVFATAMCLASWAKICPGQQHLGWERRSGRTGQGDPWLRSVLVECAWAAACAATNTCQAVLADRQAARQKCAAVPVAQQEQLGTQGHFSASRLSTPPRAPAFMFVPPSDPAVSRVEAAWGTDPTDPTAPTARSLRRSLGRR